MHTSQPTTIAAMLVGAALLASTQSAMAQALYRYVDANGKVHYTDRPAAENAGRAADKLSRQGVVLQHVPAAKTPEERAAAEQARAAAEEANKKKAEDDVIVRAEQRRIQAILSAYSSERELDAARDGALTPVLEVIQQTEQALANLNKRLADLKPEIDALAGKPIPAKTRGVMKNVEVESQALERLLEAKRTEEKAINARFSEDRRRYVEGSREIAERKSRQSARAPGAVSATTK